MLPTTLYSAPASGRYRVSAYIIVTSADPTSSTLPAVVLSWNDADSGVTQSLTLTSAVPSSLSPPVGNSTTTFAQANAIISALSGTAITYSTVGYATNTTSPPSGKMSYSLHVVLEAL